MSKITMSLLKIELDSWLELKKSMNAIPNGKMTPFGKYINNKYAFNDDAVLNEADHNTALLLIMRDHVQEIN
jgi:hypothetical protein